MSTVDSSAVYLNNIGTETTLNNVCVCDNFENAAPLSSMTQLPRVCFHYFYVLICD